MKRSQFNRGELHATPTPGRRSVTNFNDWSDRLSSSESAIKANRKRYPNVKSRYLEPGRTARAARGATKSSAIDYWKWVEHERVKLVEFDGAVAERANKLGPVNAAYLGMVEADGRLDGAAAALGYLMSADDERSVDHRSIRSQWPMLRKAVDVLVDGNGSPSALCRAAFAFVGGAGGGEGRRWLWAAELFLLAALALRPDGATYLFAAGWFYAATAAGLHDLIRSVRLLDEARLVAAEHQPLWRLPDMVRDATGVRPADADDPWRAICFVEHRALLDAARSLDAHRALRATQAACRLADLCGLDDRRRAPALYQLGVRLQATGDAGGAARAFRECAAAAAATAIASDPGLDADPDTGPDLDLDARLQAALLDPVPPDDGALKRFVRDALARRNVRLTVKAVVARGRAAADYDRPNAANAHFLLARQLVAANANRVDVNDAHQARAPLTWLGPNGQVLLNAERSHDAVARTRAKKMLRQLQLWSHVSVDRAVDDGNRDHSGGGTSSAGTSGTISKDENQISPLRSLKELTKFGKPVDMKH